MELIGKRFGKLVVLSREGSVSYGDKKRKHARWKCICDCGKETYALTGKLNIGKKVSCGCKVKENIKPKYNKEHHAWTGFGDISGSYWRQLKLNASYRGIFSDITIEQAWEIFLKQEKLCALTGLPLTFPNTQKSKVDNKPSLDRIDSEKGYVLGNVQWVHVIVNYMKQDYKQEEFLSFCKQIANYTYKMNKSIKPIGNLILIKEIPFTCKEVDLGGILVPSATQSKTKRATVIAVGAKVDPAIKVGSVVLTDFLGGEIFIEGEKHFLLSFEEVLAVEEAE